MDIFSYLDFTKGAMLIIKVEVGKKISKPALKYEIIYVGQKSKM